MAHYGLLTYQSAHGPRAGLCVGDTAVDAAFATGETRDETVLSILEDWDRAQKRLDAAAAKVSASAPGAMKLVDLDLLAPVHWPVSIYCAGANYSDHVAAMAARQGLPPEPNPKEAGLNPWHFLKPSRTAVGDNTDIHVVSKALDWEIELAAVIGRTARNVGVGEALNYVAGYCIANDLSARDLSRREGVKDTTPFKWDWIGQKCFDGSLPHGAVHRAGRADRRSDESGDEAIRQRRTEAERQQQHDDFLHRRPDCPYLDAPDALLRATWC